VPFIVYDVPEVEETVKRWSDVEYLHRKLGQKQFRTEKSVNNHFMCLALFRYVLAHKLLTQVLERPRSKRLDASHFSCATYL
jgi:hypothetical protein